MKQILILDKSVETTLVGLSLSKNDALNVVMKKEVDDLISLLEILGQVDLVICEESFLKVLKTKFNHLKFFCFIGKPEVEPIQREILKTLGIDDTLALKNNSAEEQYKSISIDYFTSIKNLSFASDLFIKIKKGTAIQYVKRLNANEIFTETEINKYIQLGLKEFYVNRDKYDMVANGIINILTSELAKKSNSFSSQKKIEQSSYNISMGRLKSVGIDEFTIQLVDETVSSIKKAVGEKQTLGKFLSFLMDNKSSYAYANSYLTCLTMTSLLKTFEWESDTIKEQVTLACFFHNVFLEDEDAQRIFDNVQLEAQSFPKEKKEQIKMHALSSSGIVSQYPKIPSIVLTIIKEHHGSLTGIDFPETPNPKLHPMSKCFMVCEYFSDQIITFKGATISKEDIAEIIINMKKKFSSGSYIQFANAIEKMTSTT